MPAISRSACGKAILLGEHAVVHAQPAIAIPLTRKRVKVSVEPQILAPTGKIRVISAVMDLNQDLDTLPENHPVFQAVLLTLAELKVLQTPSCTLNISSTLPISSGLGSSAALAVATIRALSEFLGHPLDSETVNRIAFECETYVHGKPSGIDNTVVTYEKPILFQKGKYIEFIEPGRTLFFVFADSGVRKSTRMTVASLAQQLEDNPARIQPMLEEIGQLAIQGKQALLDGNPSSLAKAINRNQEILAELDLSCPELNLLIERALKAGALAAKLTGGGKGGHMLALVEEDSLQSVLGTLQDASGGKAFSTSLDPEKKFR
jgi:mevalonate kinase